MDAFLFTKLMMEAGPQAPAGTMRSGEKKGTGAKAEMTIVTMEVGDKRYHMTRHHGASASAK